jgi:hypothetical protein
MKKDELQIHGSILHGYAQAYLNLNIIAGRQAVDLVNNIDVNEWYSLSKWSDLEELVVQSYKNSEPILERAGIEMMLAWYNYGPGKDLVKSGIDFLHYQTGSQGYSSVVKGDIEKVGEFKLKSVDEEKGIAVIYSTSTFHRKTQHGVLIGGMMAPGDLDFVDIKSNDDPSFIEIEFH